MPKVKRPKVSHHPAEAPRIVVWGTYDIGKPRVRILLRGLRENAIPVHECHAEIWRGIEDKSQLTGAVKVAKLLRWLTSYPKLIVCYWRAPPHDIVLVPYMGHLDVLIIWPFAKLRRARIVWDAFLSLYGSIVEDREMVRPTSPVAWLTYAGEWLATRAASHTFLDTQAHACYFQKRYRLPENRLGSVFVGVETNSFPLQKTVPPKSVDKVYTVLFYGQFIPLHGIDTIIEAARLLDDGTVRWVLIGKGQEEERIRQNLIARPVKHLEWYEWIDYKELIDWIRQADCCLGIFGDSDKASRVIPNKVFQILAVGKSLITRDSPAIRELIEPTSGISLIPPAQPQMLAEAIRNHCAQAVQPDPVYAQNVIERISPKAIGRQLLAEICRVEK